MIEKKRYTTPKIYHPKLPLEIIQFELLARLPVKSLLRCMSVCKAWKSVLSKPQLARVHAESQTNFKLLLLDSSSQTFHTLDRESPNTTHAIPFDDDPKGVLCLASLDGLVCVALKKTQELALWNPATGAYKKFYSFYDNILRDVISFYCISSNNYKVLHIVSSGEAMGAYIYSQRLNSWKKIPSLEIDHHISDYNWSRATFLGGRFYFTLKNKSITMRRTVISFDVEMEKFKEICFPPSSGPTLGAHLLVLSGCVHLCVAYNAGMIGRIVQNAKIDTWKMDGDDGWMKVSNFSRSQSYPAGLRHIHVNRTNGDWFAICNDNNSYSQIDVEDYVTDLYYWMSWDWYQHQGAIYIETLVSPNP